MDATERDLELSRGAIRHTISIYNNAGDRGDLDGFVSAFAADGVLEVYGRQHRGADEIRAFAASAGEGRRGSKAAGGKPYVRHHTTTSRIEITGPDAAQGWTYFIIFSDAGPPRTGIYVDAFVRRGGKWLIARRRVKMDGE